MSNFLVKNGQRYVFQGDSITDCGRGGVNRPFGDGYAKMTIDAITAKYPERKIDFINVGISGNTTKDLINRWDDDVIRLQPDWLSIKIGINDLHRYLDKVPATVSPEQFRENMFTILTETKKKTKANIILIDPFYMSTSKADNSRERVVLSLLESYLGTVHEMVNIFKTRHVKTHEAFQKQLKYRSRNYFCFEPVHPNYAGHMVIASELLKTLGW
ncbi:MAG: hypothetical protein A2231_12955 [Candidatus Firestonebacteria bacterium RIFOXYA2_FULL_40_8]|nr:MAG: hypothetical protein A2231_12955 [Candidatus Firestonebacteria bacterium RIFOXYA2_FULL_40_8]